MLMTLYQESEAFAASGLTSFGDGPYWVRCSLLALPRHLSARGRHGWQAQFAQHSRQFFLSISHGCTSERVTTGRRAAN